ncbi:uncharacterized protein BYT42DRAFT_646016 [Radiomyces spectabilis]|uniref:uncharacterized protein n=1 Tax=Radiomyces spectabilis TaxID=64574 RepID=UPI00221EE8FE|nr:uncharacterized protein BYT42DRAFT_646016 [Radiomyces spectabilis]KAI8376413.1 hypothetical protein BYT42DRAFT_646016 [Radiomyces spectabilis]
MEKQILELLEFLHQPSLEVRAIALHHIVPYTAKTSEYQPLLISNRKTLCKDLKALVREDPITAHDAIKGLINLSGDPRVQEELDDEDFIKYLALLITIPKSVTADVACMLLSNMTKYEPVCVKLINAQIKPLPELTKSDRLMDHLVEVFHRGHKKAYNDQAEFHFLASVFSNVSTIRLGRVYFLEPSKDDGTAPLTKLQIFTEDGNVIRRGGVNCTIKNCCFETRQHEKLLHADELNTLPFILLPLCGNEEYDMEEFEQFPEEIQLLDDDKKRETDPVLRMMLCEALVLLTTTRFGRDYLREKQVYRVIQRLHAAETDEDIKEKCVSIVDMLIRDEGAPEISEVKEENEEDEDEDLIIEEIA